MTTWTVYIYIYL